MFTTSTQTWLEICCLPRASCVRNMFGDFAHCARCPSWRTVNTEEWDSHVKSSSHFVAIAHIFFLSVGAFYWPCLLISCGILTRSVHFAYPSGFNRAASGEIRLRFNWRSAHHARGPSIRPACYSQPGLPIPLDCGDIDYFLMTPFFFFHYTYWWQLNYAYVLQRNSSQAQCVTGLELRRRLL